MNEPKGAWTDLFLAFRMTLDPRKAWLGFKGLILSFVLLGLILGVAAAIHDAAGVRFVRRSVLSEAGEPTGESLVERTHYVHLGAAQDDATIETDVWEAVQAGQLGRAVRGTSRFAGSLWRSAVQDIADRATEGPARRYMPVRVLWLSESVWDLLVLIGVCGLTLMLIWSYYGGAIMRLAAVEYALGERIELSSATAYAWRKHHCLYGGPLGLVSAMIAIGLGLLIGGLVAWNVLVVAVGVVGLLAAGVCGGVVREKSRSGLAGLGAGLVVLAATAVACVLLTRNGIRIPYVGEVLLGILSPLTFAAGLLAAILAIWVVFGTGLMFGSVASSDTDTFQAWSRSFYYLFCLPWRFAAYCAVSLVYGAACLGFVYLVRVLMEWATLAPISAGLVGRFESVFQLMNLRDVVGSGQDRVLAFFFRADSFLLDMAFLSIAVAYLFTAKTIAFFLLRLRGDKTPVTEVHLEPRDREFLIPATVESQEDPSDNESNESES